MVSTQNTVGRQSWNQCPQITLQLYFNLLFTFSQTSLVLITLVIQSLFAFPDDSLEKTDAGRDWGQEEKGTTEDEMAGWHH